MPEVWNFLSNYLETLSELALQGERIYLVGGAVRDILMGRISHDLDFVVEGDARLLARRMANRLKGDFYMLDAERQMARVLFREVNGNQNCFDFASLHASDLESDLRARDFTVNAIAIDIHAPKKLIDPLGGAVDLRAKCLRACAVSAFQDDPLRVLRGVRLGLDFGFHIQPETTILMRQAAAGLKRISSERIRDELFRILDGNQPAAGMRLLDHLGVLQFILPELPVLKGVNQSAPHIHDVWEHTLAVISELGQLLKVLCAPYDEDTSANLMLGLAALHLGRYRDQFSAHFTQRLNPSRSRKALVMLAALYHDCAKPLTQQIATDGKIHFFNHEILGEEIIKKRGTNLALSQAEVERLNLLVRQHMRIHLLAEDAKPPSRRAIYRFFKSVGEAGVELILLALADRLATQGVTLTPPEWQRELDICRILLESWWEQREKTVQPMRLINGHDLMAQFGLSPNKKIGELLEAVYEAQALGEITTRDEALTFARDWLNQRDGSP